MTVEEKVANLTTSVDQLTDAVNVKKQTLDASVADGVSARDQSQGYRDEARTARDQSQSHANTALGYSQDAASAVAYQDLTSIAETKAETAFDVFVYDTSKDSDGGAWRHRTQHTSWYNEPLNTTTRGARREFPAVAVIMAEADRVTIYDGDDPALPMWMVIAGTTSSRNLGFSLGGNNTCVSSLNGIICFGDDNASSDSGGLLFVEFLKDNLTRLADIPSLGGTGLQVVDRNANLDLPIRNTDVIVNRNVNDVAMTVLPDAPIDYATGLPVPTIAVATDGGVSVIKDDGAVFDSASTLEFRDVAFDLENTLFYMRKIRTYSLYMAVTSDYTAGDNFGDINASIPQTGQDFNLLGVRQQSTIAFGIGTVATGGRSSGPKVLGIHKINKGNLPNVLSAGITSTYNTGWMPGDIKGAFLSDTDDTDLVGATIFDVDFSTYADQAAAEADDWVFGTGWSLAGGQALFTAGSGAGKLRRSVPLSPDNSYLVRVDGTYGAGAYVSLTLSNQGTFAGGIGSGAKVFTVDGNGGSQFFEISAGTNGDYLLDTASFKLADADRSVNNNGLIVNSTVIRSPVATGADLVAYSGFSSSNYLEQPYNSDLDFGTGDFCVMGWFKQNDPALDYMMYRSAPNGGAFSFDVVADGTGDRVIFHTGTELAGSTPIYNNGWNHFAAVRENGVAYLYINGSLDASKPDSSDVNVGSTAVTRLGAATNGNGIMGNGSLALWRIGATPPTPEQIKHIYEDEKVLYQENAQATLYGNSDAVTALAHDEVTDLLHVGTSDGRSVFQGLRRVDNTIDPVSTAISASNGLIVED